MSALSDIHATCYEVFNQTHKTPISTAIKTVKTQHPELPTAQVVNLVTGYWDMWVKDSQLTPVVI